MFFEANCLLNLNKISILPAIFKQYIPTDCPMINELQLIAEKSNDVLSAVRYIAYQETLLHVQIKSRDQEIILLRKINLIGIFFYQQFGLMTKI